MESIMLPIDFMKWGYAFIPMLIVAYLLTMFFTGNLVKAFLYVMKAMAYGGLAYFMWKHYQGLQQIDVISGFTFIFCCYEATDNLFSLIAIPVEKFRRIKEKTQYSLEMLDLNRRFR